VRVAVCERVREADGVAAPVPVCDPDCEGLTDGEGDELCDDDCEGACERETLLICEGDLVAV
jgi:hypothetical protein